MKHKLRAAVDRLVFIVVEVCEIHYNVNYIMINSKVYLYSACTIKSNENKIEAFEIRGLRRIGKIIWKDRITNIGILDKLKTEINILFDTQKRKCS